MKAEIKIERENERHCKECGRTIVGRSDKLYCCEQCKTSYFNRLYREKNKIIRETNRILLKNHRILSELVESGHTTCRISELLSKGFDFDYVTGVRASEKTDIPAVFCYDCGYTLDRKGNVVLLSIDR